MKNFFALTTGAIKNLFSGYGLTVSGPRATALSDINGHFQAIATIMADGKVVPELGEFANQQLFIASSAVTGAVINGWAGGNGGQY